MNKYPEQLEKHDAAIKQYNRQVARLQQGAQDAYKTKLWAKAQLQTMEEYMQRRGNALALSQLSCSFQRRSRTFLMNRSISWSGLIHQSPLNQNTTLIEFQKNTNAPQPCKSPADSLCHKPHAWASRVCSEPDDLVFDWISVDMFHLWNLQHLNWFISSDLWQRCTQAKPSLGCSPIWTAIQWAKKLVHIGSIFSWEACCTSGNKAKPLGIQYRMA